MWRWLLLLTAVVTVFASTIPIKRSYQKYCGPELNEALQLLCNGIYNTMFKKSYPNFESESYGPPDDNELTFPFSTKSNALSFMTGSYGRHKRGVYDECCRKSCTVTELITYCGEQD